MIHAKRLMLVALLATTPQAYAEQAERSQFNMPPGVTSNSQAVYDLHMLMLWVCVVIGAVVFLVMGWSLWRHRLARGVKPAQFAHNTRLEIVWTVIPVLILAGVAVPASQVLLDVNDNPPADVTVDVRGSQWKWHYSYADEGIAFDSNLDAASREASQMNADKSPGSVDHYLLDVDNPLVLPVGKTIRLRLTAADVIHSWWVPDLGFKRDAIPGYVNEVSVTIEEPGTYRGQCAELCGAGHGFMPIVVKALPEDEYQTWLAQSKQAQAAEQAQAKAPWTMETAMSEGERVYTSQCLACHQANGQGLPGTFPALDGSKVATGPIEDHANMVIHGSPNNPVMRAFGGELSNRQLAAVLTYERNAWSNATGDLVTPEQMEAAR